MGFLRLQSSEIIVVLKCYTVVLMSLWAGTKFNGTVVSIKFITTKIWFSIAIAFCLGWFLSKQPVNSFAVLKFNQVFILMREFHHLFPFKHNVPLGSFIRLCTHSWRFYDIYNPTKEVANSNKWAIKPYII